MVVVGVGVAVGAVGYRYGSISPRPWFYFVHEILSCSVCVEDALLINVISQNIEIQIKTKIKQTRGLSEIAAMKFRSRRNLPRCSQPTMF